MSQQNAARSLVRKLSEVMLEVVHVPKSGHNRFHGYSYATEADIVSAVREGMARRHLMLVPDVESSEVKEVQRKNGVERLVTLRVRFTVLDGDSGETHSFCVTGEGTDAGDKAGYKAITGATKYAIMKLFLIPTGDDPEEEGHGQRSPRQPLRTPPPPAPPAAPAQGERRAPAQSAARDAGRVELGKPVPFGPYKGRPLATLTDEEVSETLDIGNACVTTGRAPSGELLSQKQSDRMRAMLQEVGAEVDRRMGGEPGAGG